MQRPISVRWENPAEPMILSVSMATGTNSMFATSRGYFRLFKSSAALDAKPWFKMLAENESVQVAFQANVLSPLKGKDVTPSDLLPSPRSRPTGSRVE